MGHYGDSADVGDAAVSADLVPGKRYYPDARGPALRLGHDITFGDLLGVLDEVAGPVDVDVVNWAGLEDIVRSPRRRGARGETLRDRLKREHRELSDAIGVLAGKLARREQQLAHLARYPDEDPCADGAVLRFTKKFPDGEHRYTYVATRVDGLWYLTGERSPQGVTWEKLVGFMGLGVDEVFHVNGAKRVRGGKFEQAETKIIG